MNLDRAKDVAEDLLSPTLPRRWRHVAGVAQAGLELRLSCAPTVGAAGMLHDIGYSPSLIDTGFHPIDGARHLRRIGCDESIVNLVAHHSCAMIEAEIRGLGDVLAEEFPFDPSLPHDELCFCDMTTSADGEPTTLDDRIASIRQRRAGDAPVMAFLDQGEVEIRRIVAEVQAKID